jgi:DNA-binding NarL/FixJ family response regulator
MRIVIVEDHRLFRELFRKVLETELGCTILGEVSTVAEAKRLIAAQKPDIMVLDLHLPDGDGFQVADYARARWGGTVRILIISSHCDDYTLFQVERSGAQGFVDKNCQSIAMAKQAMAALVRGETYFSPAYLEAKRARLRNPQNFTKILSVREQAVLSLVGNSLSDAEIAKRLGISPATVQTHRSHLLRKLNISNSLKLIQYAIGQGFTRITVLRNGKPVLS